MSLSDIKTHLAQNNQSHLLKFWETLDDNQRKTLHQQLYSLRCDELNELFQKAIETAKNTECLDDRMTPIPPQQCESESLCSSEKLAQYKRRGLQEIAEGTVAVLLLAGGQGTRLGVSYPKGMYSVGLPSGRTLFQIQAERILKIQQLAEEQEGRSCSIPWYIMTSEATNFETEKFLRSHNFFGINEANITIFEQNMLPCFDFDGKILLEAVNKIAEAPDGNGGLFKALRKVGILDNMKSRGIRYLQVYGVDNILVKVADPVFIGYCVTHQAQCGNKVIRKTIPSEALGVTCIVDGLFKVVEYSEISPNTANLQDSQGNLVFNAGNICQHFFTLDFLFEVATEHEDKMKLHIAKKKIPCVDDNGTHVKPSTPNGIKIEKFVFDVFEFCKRLVIWEVPRENEFSALKNSDAVGTECPSTAKAALLALHKRYIENAGGIVEGDEVEISPLVSYAGEGLEGINGKRFISPFVLEPTS